jgi:hypothetical protein
VNSSEAFLPLLYSIRDLFQRYPIQSGMGSVRVVVGSGARQLVVVQLVAGDLGSVAAGIVEWDRTLAAGRLMIERSSDGATVTLGVAGHVDEDGTDVEVYGTAPFEARRLGTDVMPGETVAVPFEVLAVWAIGSGRVL